MQKIKTFSLVIIFLLTLFWFSNQVYSATNGSNKTLYVGWAQKLNVFVSDNWLMKQSSNYIFVNKNAPNNLEVTLIKKTHNYKNPQENLKLIKAYEKMLLSRLKVKPTEVKEGFDNISGQKVPWILIFTNAGSSVKFLFPSINGTMYSICVGFKGNAPFNQAEELINEIVKAIQKKDTPDNIVNNKPVNSQITSHQNELVTTQPQKTYNQPNTPDPLVEKSYSARVISQSPDSTELQNGTVLYSKAINSYTNEGKKLFDEHSFLANQAVEEIHSLSRNFHQVRNLNKEFYANLGNQMTTWNNIAVKNPSLKNYSELEKLIYATSLDYQLKENYHWATIDGIIEEIYAANNNDKRPVNQSITKSLLYTKLLLAYTDLNKFYDSKYEILLPYCAFNHAAEHNSGSNIPSSILPSLNPLHGNEMKLIEALIAENNKTKSILKDLSSKSDQLRAFYNKMDNYSLSSIKNTITELTRLSNNLKTKQNSSSSVSDDISTLNSYIAYYKSLENHLETKIVSYEIKEAILASLKNEDRTLTASINIIPSELAISSFSDWGISFESFKEKVHLIAKGSADYGKKAYYLAKAAPSALLACADYTIGKTAETYYDYQAKKALKEAYPEDYEKYIKQYDEFSEKAYVVSIKDTFIDPLKATLAGDTKNGIGQAGINNFQQSAKKMDQAVDDITGSTFVSQIALNVATLGGYGLAKDYMTINDGNASATEKAWAAVGTALNFVPIASASKALKEGGDTIISSLSKNIAVNQKELAKICSKIPGAPQALKNLTSKTATLFDDIVASGANSISADELVSAYGKSVFKDTVTDQVLITTEKQLTAKTLKQVVAVPATTIAEGGNTAIKTFFNEMAPDAIAKKMKEMSTQSLSQVVKNSESFVGQSLSNSVGVKDVTNFVISSTVDNAFNDGMKSVVQTLTNTGSTSPSNNYNSNQTSAATAYPQYQNQTQHQQNNNNNVSAGSTYPEYQNSNQYQQSNSAYTTNNYQAHSNQNNNQSWGQSNSSVSTQSSSQSSSQTWTSNTASAQSNNNSNSSKPANTASASSNKPSDSNNTASAPKINIDMSKIINQMNHNVQQTIIQNQQILNNLYLPPNF